MLAGDKGVHHHTWHVVLLTAKLSLQFPMHRFLKFVYLFFFFEKEFYYVVQAGHELETSFCPNLSNAMFPTVFHTSVVFLILNVKSPSRASCIVQWIRLQTLKSAFQNTQWSISASLCLSFPICPKAEQRSGWTLECLQHVEIEDCSRSHTFPVRCWLQNSDVSAEDTTLL